MARGVDDVDLDTVVHDRAVLRVNGDPAFPFQIVGVHHAVDDLLVVAEDVALIEESVDQRGLARVDVCNHGNINNWIFLFHSFLLFNEL